MVIETHGVRLDISGTEKFLARSEVDALAPAVAKAAAALRNRTCPGAEFLGWLDLPVAVSPESLETMAAAAAKARGDCEIFVVIGIGGSYLGAQAFLEALGSSKESGSQAGSGPSVGSGPQVIFAGTGLCSAAMSQVLEQIGDREVRLCVISKSGTTLEPGIAFRFLRGLLVDRYGRSEAARRITAITDAAKGSLKRLADEEGYETFVIPDDVGGRFSVLTPVGLLPMAVGGINIREVLAGARQMRKVCQREDLRTNPAHLYAATRYGLYCAGFRTEILSSFHTGLRSFQEWWKQLFGESEGKEGKGIFPASALFTTDLHSLGQYIQDGRRALMETFLCVKQARPDLLIPAEAEDAPAGMGGVEDGSGGPAGKNTGEFGGEGFGLGRKRTDPDGLDYLAGRSVDEINWLAYQGTCRAHIAGGVPCLGLEVDRLTPCTLGGLVYLMEKTVAVSGLLLGVNPFDQPGVEAYKREMFNLLGKPSNPTTAQSPCRPNF
jgi:glucose-6-phosphate isomerase